MRLTLKAALKAINLKVRNPETTPDLRELLHACVESRDDSSGDLRNCR